MGIDRWLMRVGWVLLVASHLHMLAFLVAGIGSVWLAVGLAGAGVWLMLLALWVVSRP